MSDIPREDDPRFSIFKEGYRAALDAVENSDRLGALTLGDSDAEKAWATRCEEVALSSYVGRLELMSAQEIKADLSLRIKYSDSSRFIQATFDAYMSKMKGRLNPPGEER